MRVEGLLMGDFLEGRGDLEESSSCHLRFGISTAGFDAFSG